MVKIKDLNTYEVTAIGDLVKGNLTDFPWRTQIFALIGTKLMYYDPKGIKIGELDISGCEVKKISNKDAKLSEKSTKYPFLLEGNKKRYILSAASDDNRNKWICTIEKQMREFSHPVRRFIRASEVVHANGFVKIRNLFGETPILLVLTNFPRIIEIFPATVTLKDQYTWDPAHPPVFTKINEKKFKISIGKTQLLFEDPSNGMTYWEEIFSRVGRFELWQPPVIKTLKIGFTKKAKAMTKVDVKVTKSKSSESESNGRDIEILKDASASVQLLSNVIASKLEEIDLYFAMATSTGDVNQQNDVRVKDKQRKLMAFQENVKIINDNLAYLIEKYSKLKTKVNFDVSVIDDLIEEARKLDNDEYDEPVQTTATPSVQALSPTTTDATNEMFSETVNYIDQVVAEVECENTEIFRMTTLRKKSSSVITRPTTRSSVFSFAQSLNELDLSAAVFKPEDPNKRPPGWVDIKMTRVMAKEQKDRENGLAEDEINLAREDKINAEEVLMLAEVAKLGTVQGLADKDDAAGRKRASTLAQDITGLERISAANFDAFDPSKRPAFWSEIRLRRVMLKEHINRLDFVPDAVLVDQRSLKLIDEEMIMVGEVLCYGRLLNIGETGKDIYSHPASKGLENFDASSKPRPSEWEAARLTRVRLKELEAKLNDVDNRVIADLREVKTKEEEDDMVREAAATGSITLLGKRSVARQVDAAAAAHNDVDTLIESLEAVNLDDAQAQPKPVVIEQPKPYRNEKISYDVANTYNAPGLIETVSHRHSSVVINHADVSRYLADPVAISKGSSGLPQGWADIRLRRVFLKEWEDRKNGVSEEEILEKRYARELEAEQEMINELDIKGKIALFEKGIKRPTLKAYTLREYDVTSFSAACETVIRSLNDEVSQLKTSI